MSYCSKLYVVEKTKVVDDDCKFYARDIAMFDLGQIYELSDTFRNQKETNCFIYADDGNTEILEDRYGEPLTELTVESTINLLKKDMDIVDSYRRILPFLSMLESFYQQQQNGIWRNLAVLHYGY